MPRPFDDLTIKDLQQIYKEMLVFLDTIDQYKGIINLYNLPTLIYNAVHIHFDKNEDYGTIEFTGKQNERASINLDRKYNVITYKIDDDTSELVINIVKGFLLKNKFINAA